MPNSDNTYGTFNKATCIISQSPAPEQDWVVFANVQEAKDHFLTNDMQAVYDECCTNLQWALVADENGNTKLKVTYDFGTKGGDIAPSDDWAEQFTSRMSALTNPPSTTGMSEEIITDADSSEHLF
jgi:hypothetical protein